MHLIDITPSVTPALAVWPGDTPPSREVLCDMHRGDNITLSTLRATVHLGAHADAPSHYGTDAPTIEQRQRKGAGGRDELDLIVADSHQRNLSSGRHDSMMREQYGARQRPLR